MKIITLLTDFGTRDGYAGIMKGVISIIAPDARIIDITHEIHAQDVQAGMLALQRVVPYYPPGTIHLVVVDPGVGTQRRPIAAHAGDCYLVGPDNGLFTPIFQNARERQQTLEIVHLNRPDYWLERVSAVFHGRDIFAPAAAHLANGVALDQLGERISNPVIFTLPEPDATPAGWRGAVVHVDAFGNLATNISRVQLGGRQAAVRLAGVEISGLSHTFGDGQPGALVALIDSDDRLAVCVVNGSAAEQLSIGVGAIVEVAVFGGVGA